MNMHIFDENAGDCPRLKGDSHFTDCIVVDYTVGMRVTGASNRLTRCHVWSGTVPPAGMTFADWSALYVKRKELLARHADAAELEPHLAATLVF